MPEMSSPPVPQTRCERLVAEVLKLYRDMNKQVILRHARMADPILKKWSERLDRLAERFPSQFGQFESAKKSALLLADDFSLYTYEACSDDYHYLIGQAIDVARLINVAIAETTMGAAERAILGADIDHLLLGIKSEADNLNAISARVQEDLTDARKALKNGNVAEAWTILDRLKAYIVLDIQTQRE